MPRHVAKSDLPTKICPVCGRPFTWRKKWERVWDKVITCSDRCRRAKGSGDHRSRAQDRAEHDRAAPPMR